MSYTELTADDKHLSLEELHRLSLVVLSDGTMAQRVVEVSAVDSFTLTSGSVTDTYTYRFDFEGEKVYVRDGYEDEAAADNLVWCVVLADGGSGLGWNVTDGIGEVIYFALGDVPHPSDVDNWSNSGLTGTLPLPVIS